MCIDAGLSHRVDVQLKDYRLLEGKFDKLVSIEMIEAVVSNIYRLTLINADDLLKPNGLGLIQSYHN